MGGRADGPAATPGPSVVLVAALVGLAATAAMAPVVAGQPATDGTVVALHDDGSATLTVAVAFDLANESEREAFARLEANRTRREAMRSAFAGRLRAVADSASEAAGRDMSIGGTAVALRRTDDGATGVVELTATWQGLAAVDGDRLVVTEPFASGFTTERRLVVRAPDGYVVASATPSPAAEDRTTATWGPGTSLEGFRLVVAPDGRGGALVPGGQPGFGVGAALLALLAGVGVGARRARRRDAP